MATITLRIVKGTGLTYPEIDANFFNINTELEGHINDTVDAHDASAISYNGSSNLSSNNLESAVDELDAEKSGKAENNTFTGNNTFGTDGTQELTINSQVILDGSPGQVGQVPVSMGADSAPKWFDRFPRVKKLPVFRTYLRNFNMVLMEDGTLRTWGFNDQGQGAQYHTVVMNDVYQPTFARNTTFPPPSAKIVDVVIGGGNAFLLYDNGWVYSTGHNAGGGCGLGNTTSPQTAFARIDYFVTNNISIDKLVVNSYDSGISITVLARGTNKRAYTWGNTFRGDNTSGATSISTPFPVPGLTDVNDIWLSTCAAGTQLFALNGTTLFAWGYNQAGVANGCGLGTGLATATNILVPTACVGITGTPKKVIPVTGHNNPRTVYYQSAFVLTEEGKVFTTGYNGSGQLGLGDVANRTSFVQVSALNAVNIIDIEVINGGPYIALNALSDVGKLYTCGYGSYGLLADGTAASSKVTPTEVIGAPLFTRLLTFGARPFTTTGMMGGMTATGQVWIWGYAESGSFGVAAGTLSSVNLNSPAFVVFPQLEEGERVVEITGDGSNSTTFAWALTNYGRLMGAGYNANHEVNPGNVQNRSYRWKFINMY